MRLSTKIWRGVSLRTILIGIITFFAVLAFTVTGVTSSMGGLDANLAAQVGTQSLSLKNLQLATQRQNRRDMPDEAARTAAMRATLDSMIQELVVVEESTRVGWGANDLEVATWIRKVPIFQDEATKQFEKKRYDDFIRSGQMSELDLFQEGRQSIAVQKYSTLLNLDTHLPGKLAEEYARRTAASFEIEFVDLDPSQETLEPAVRERAQAFASDGANAKKLESSYEARKSQSNRTDSPRLSAILVSHKEATQAQGAALERSRDDALKRTQEILARAAAGEDFAELANTMSDDVKTSATKNGGDLGFVDESSLDPAALEAGRALKTDGQVSDVVDTTFGFRILKRTGYRPAVNRTLDEVKVELAETIVRPLVIGERKQELTKSIEPLLTAGKATDLDSKLQELGLAWRPVAEPVTTSTRFVTDLGPAEPIVREAFKLRAPKDLIPKILNISGKNVIVRLVARTDTPVEPADIDASRDIQAAQARSRFANEARRTLYDVYSQNKEIKRNASLFAAPKP